MKLLLVLTPLILYLLYKRTMSLIKAMKSTNKTLLKVELLLFFLTLMLSAFLVFMAI